MDREGDVDARLLRAALTDLSRTLDALREYLEPRERVASRPGLGPAVQSAPADSETLSLGLVHEFLSLPSTDLRPGEVFDRAMERVSTLVGADRAMLFLVEAGEGRLVAQAARGFRKEDLGVLSVRVGEGVVGRAVVERRLLVVHSPSGDGESPDDFIRRMGVREAIAVPVCSGDAVVGVLLVGRHRPEAPLGARDALLLLAIADRVGRALANQAELSRRARRIAYLADFRSYVEQLPSEIPLGDMLAEACRIACRLANVRAAAVAVDAGADELELRAAQGLPPGIDPKAVSVRVGLTAELYAGNECVACRDVRARPIPERSFLADGGFRGCLLLPISSGHGVSGVLYLADTAVREFSEEEIGAARALAQLVASALYRAAGPEGLRVPAGGASLHERPARIEKARILSEMAGGVARELNNVFAVILGKSRLVLARAHDEGLREGLTVLEEAAWRGADIVHRLGALAATVPAESPGVVDVVALVRDVVAEARARFKADAERGGVSIDVMADVQSGPPVRGSESVLRDVLMSVVLNAVDAMAEGGRLTLWTRVVDDGLEIVIEPETETPDEANEPIPVPESPPVRRDVSILVLEDEDRVRSFLVEALTEAGHRVEAVSDALSGLAKLETEAFDVVLADLALPERSGLAVASAVKRLHPQTPVILITGWGHVLDPDRVREQGVDLMLVKPFRAGRALSLVSQALAMRAAGR